MDQPNKAEQKALEKDMKLVTDFLRFFLSNDHYSHFQTYLIELRSKAAQDVD